MATISTAPPKSSSAAPSCTEFRNGYRVQRRAYERRCHTPTLETIITNRRPKNEYVDRLKQFYNNTGTEIPENGVPSRSDFLAGDNRLRSKSSGKRNNNNKNTNNYNARSTSSSHAVNYDPPDVKSILRLPEMKVAGLGKSNSGVKITLPQRRKDQVSTDVTVADDNCTDYNKPRTPITALSAKIPPPVPFLLSNESSRLTPLDDKLSSSLTSDMAASILEAVVSNELKKKSSSRKSSHRQQRNTTRQRYANNINNNNNSNNNTNNNNFINNNSPNSNYNNNNVRSSGKTNYKIDPRRLAMKMTLPCRIGCCFCVYSSILGPVKIFLTRSQKPKQEPWLAGIRDGHGRLVIPVSRKGDVKGLVYDAHSHSLHPPAKGQRPLYPSAKSHHHHHQGYRTTTSSGGAVAIPDNKKFTDKKSNRKCVTARS